MLSKGERVEDRHGTRERNRYIVQAYCDGLGPKAISKLTGVAIQRVADIITMYKRRASRYAKK